MKKTDIRTIEKYPWSMMKSDTLWHIFSILHSTQILLDYNIKENEGSFGYSRPHIAAGLYTYAVEEFGKYLYLKSITPNNEKYHIDYKEFTDHHSKFKRAIDDLPEDCRLIHKKGQDERYVSDYDEDTIADFEIRKNIFYSDFEGTQIQEEVEADDKTLQIAVTKLWEIADSELDKTNKEKPR